MKASKNCTDLIKKYEGVRLKAYKCPAGVWTIGYGHTGSDVTQGKVITDSEANVLLQSDLVKFEKKVEKYDNVYHWTQNEFDALVSFAFNIGSIDQLVANGHRTKAQIGDKISAYNKAGGKVLNGLTKRRLEEQALFRATSLDNTLLPYMDIAKEVLQGKWGNGLERKQSLEKAGYDYSKVQNAVNKLLMSKRGK